MTTHLTLLILYSIALVALGLWVGRLVRGTADFFVAGRRLNVPLLAGTILAANIGAGSTIGATSAGYRDGLSAWWWNGSAGLGSLVLAVWVGPRIWRLAREHDLYTVGDWLEFRYGRPVRGVVAALIWVATLFILAGQLVGGAAILQVVAGVPAAAGCLIAGAGMTIYFVAGGLLGSAWVNALQLVVILAGFGFAVPLALGAAGGWGAVSAWPDQPAGFLDVWHSTGSGSGWTFLMLLGPAFVISPGLIQKVYGAADERAVRAGVGLNAAALMVFALAPALIGMAARVQYPDLPRADLALPTILANDLPVALGALALAGVFSAEVSSADAVLFMLSTSLSQDLYRRFVHPGASDARVLSVARWAAAAGGTLGVAISIVLSPSVIGALSIFYTVLGVILFVPVVAGLATSRGGTVEAMGSIAAGVTAMIAWRLATDGQGVGALTPNVAGILAGAVAFGGVALARGERSRGPSPGERRRS